MHPYVACVVCSTCVATIAISTGTSIIGLHDEPYTYVVNYAKEYDITGNPNKTVY